MHTPFATFSGKDFNNRKFAHLIQVTLIPANDFSEHHTRTLSPPIYVLSSQDTL